MELPIGGGHQRPQQPMQINLKKQDMIDAKTVTCKCGCKAFLSATAFKEIPGILVGNPTPQILPIQGVFVCAKCGEIAPFVKKDKQLCEILGIVDDE